MGQGGGSCSEYTNTSKSCLSSQPLVPSYLHPNPATFLEFHRAYQHSWESILFLSSFSKFLLFNFLLFFHKDFPVLGIKRYTGGGNHLYHQGLFWDLLLFDLISVFFWDGVSLCDPSWAQSCDSSASGYPECWDALSCQALINFSVLFYFSKTPQGVDPEFLKVACIKGHGSQMKVAPKAAQVTLPLF